MILPLELNAEWVRVLVAANSAFDLAVVRAREEVEATRSETLLLQAKYDSLQKSSAEAQADRVRAEADLALAALSIEGAERSVETERAIRSETEEKLAKLREAFAAAQAESDNKLASLATRLASTERALASEQAVRSQLEASAITSGLQLAHFTAQAEVARQEIHALRAALDELVAVQAETQRSRQDEAESRVAELERATAREIEWHSVIDKLRSDQFAAGKNISILEAQLRQIRGSLGYRLLNSLRRLLGRRAERIESDHLPSSSEALRAETISPDGVSEATTNGLDCLDEAAEELGGPCGDTAQVGHHPSAADSRLGLARLASLDDAAFLRSAYVSILGRPIDRCSLESWTLRLREGDTREDVIQHLSESIEAPVQLSAIADEVQGAR